MHICRQHSDNVINRLALSAGSQKIIVRYLVVSKKKTNFEPESKKNKGSDPVFRSSFFN